MEKNNIEKLFGNFINNYYEINDGKYTKDYDNGTFEIVKLTKKGRMLDSEISIKYCKNNLDMFESYTKHGKLSINHIIDKNTRKYFNFEFNNKVDSYMIFEDGNFCYKIYSNQIIKESKDKNSSNKIYNICDNIINYKINDEIVLGYNMATKTPLVFLKKNNSDEYFEIIYNKKFKQKLSAYNNLIDYNKDLVKNTLSVEFIKLFESYNMNKIAEIEVEKFFELMEISYIYNNYLKYLDNTDIVSCLDIMNKLMHDIYYNKHKYQINAFINQVNDIDINNPDDLKKIKTNIFGIKKSIKKLIKNK